MKRTIEKKFSVFSLRINSQFPFIHFDVFRTIYSVNEKSCEFSIKGVLLTLILALLPRYWDACPWDAGTGIAIGGAIAVLWTIFTFIRFRIKVRKLDEAAAYKPAPKAYNQAPPPRQKIIETEAPTTTFDVTKKYFIAKYSDEIAFWKTEGCRYLILTETAADMTLFLADNENYKHYRPYLCHIDTVVQLANMIGCHRIRMITESGSYTRPLTDITSQPYNDLLEDTLKSQDELFVVVAHSEDGAHYITSDDSLIVCLSKRDADALGLQLSTRNEVQSVNVQELRDIVVQVDGLCILDGNKTALYNKPNTHVLPILDRIKPIDINQQTTHHDLNAPAQPNTSHDTTCWNSDFATHTQRYVDEDDITKNTIFAKNTFLSFDGNKTMRNSNVLLLGGTERGEYNRYSNFIIPNMLTQSCNFVTIDSHGALTESVHDQLKELGYEVMVLNLKDFTPSDKYNPFDYLETDAGVQSLSEVFIQNTRMDASKNSYDPFVERSERIILQACISYLLNTQPKNKHNFSSVHEFLNTNNPEMLREIFANAISNAPSDDVAKCFKTVSEMSPKNLMSILISLKMRLIMFGMTAFQNITNEDTIDLYSMQEGKKALFIIAPPNNNGFNVIATMLLSQLMHITLAFGRNKNKHLRFFINATTSSGYISDLCRTIPMARASNASVVLAVSTIGQLQSMYPDVWDSASSAMDSLLYLGSDDKSTIDYTAKRIISSKTLDKSLTEITTDLTLLKEDECIVMIQGIKPFKDKKF